MPFKQLAALFMCNVVPFIVALALIGLLPIYAIDLGANEVFAGIYLSLSFGSLAVATLSSGWLSNRFQRRKLMVILSAVIAVPATFLMG